MEEKTQLVLLLLSVFFLSSIPIIRTQYFYGYDPFYFLMNSQEIIKTSNIQTYFDNPPFYPLLISIVSLLSSLHASTIMRFLSPFIITLLGLLVYILTVSITRNHKIGLIAIIFLCVTSSLNTHWFFQFHLNYLEQRPTYLVWALIILCVFLVYKAIQTEKLKYSMLAGIMYGMVFIGYYLSGFLLTLSLCTYALFHLVLNRNFFKTMKIFLPIALIGALIGGGFVLFNLKNILETIEMERGTIVHGREPLDYFEFFCIPGILSLFGVLIAIKNFSKYYHALAWWLGTILYSEVFWVHKVFPQLLSLFSYTEFALREMKLPIAVMAAMGLYFIYEKINGKKAVAFILIILIASASTSIWGFMFAEPFSYTNILPLSVFQHLNKLEDGTVLTNDFTSMLIPSFTNKNVITIMFTLAGQDYRSKKSDLDYAHDAIWKSPDDFRLKQIINKYGVKYILLNEYLFGRQDEKLEQSYDWEKIYESDEGTIFLYNPKNLEITFRNVSVLVLTDNYHQEFVSDDLHTIKVKHKVYLLSSNWFSHLNEYDVLMINWDTLNNQDNLNIFMQHKNEIDDWVSKGGILLMERQGGWSPYQFVYDAVLGKDENMVMETGEIGRSGKVNLDIYHDLLKKPNLLTDGDIVDNSPPSPYPEKWEYEAMDRIYAGWFTSYKDGWKPLVLTPDGKPIMLVKESGQGIIISSTMYFGGPSLTRLLENIIFYNKKDVG